MHTIFTEQYDDFVRKYPHLKMKIELRWGTQAGRDAIIEAIGDSGRIDGTSRSGFPKEDASLLFKLLSKHDDLFPQFDSSKDYIIPFTTPGYKIHKPVKQYDGINLFDVIKFVVVMLVGLVLIKKFLL